MSTAHTPTQVPAKAAANGAAVSDGSEALLDRVVGQAPAAVVREKAHQARTSLTTAGETAVVAAKAHPIASILALASGLAIIGLLANPATRKTAIEGGSSLWKRLVAKLPTT